MTCVEKELDYDLDPMLPQSDEIKALHPWGKVPVLRHGDFTLFETLAITRYIDEAFDGPALQPKDARRRAVMNQMISLTMDYVYPSMVRTLIIQRLVVPGRGGTPDEAAIAEALPAIETQFLVLSGALHDHLYMAGDTATLADFFLLPIIFYVNFTPEGQKIVANSPRILKWLETMGTRPSDKATLPPLDALKG